MTKETKMDPAAELEAATVRSDGAVQGVRLVGPAGQMVLASTVTVHLESSVARGLYVEGIKDGWKLATAEDEKKLAAENEKKDKEAAASEKKAEEYAASVAAAIKGLQASVKK